MTPTRGVDLAAAQYGRQYGHFVVLVGADADLHGRSAGLKRNPCTVALADAVVCFWDGQSRGSIHTMKEAARQGKPFIIIRPDGMMSSEIP